MRIRVSVLLLIAGFSAAWASGAPAGRWEGDIRLPGRTIRVVIDLAEDSAGKWIGSAILPGVEIKGAPLSDISVSGDAVSFALKGAFGDPTFQAHLASGTLSGDFKQAGNTAPFQLHSAGAAQVEPIPVSTAVRKDLEGDWHGTMSYAGNPIKIQIQLSNQPGGKATGQFTIIGKRETKLPIDLITQEGDMLTVEVRERGITYEGRFRKDQNQIDGAFMQGGLELPLKLQPPQKN